ncbi:hypothetical protein Ahy_B08g092285 [Arachis hypogaea]|uniref:Aminotransferase-like plant mobile domain-containing protein n=1 Tax=Arachis hypogaea TaxID=3818 RepID=A0A444Y3I0_ARAHY|nr:hypothetical protein Ahy_B08g092285 [Arachis hypogaea]
MEEVIRPAVIMAANQGDMYRLNGIAHVARFIDQENKFRVLPAHASKETLQIYAQGYIMMLLSTVLFTDKSGARVNLRPRWTRQVQLGFATLSWLYTCLCRVANRNVKNLARPLSLLQFWIFWRFPTFRPRGFDAILWPLAASYIIFMHNHCYVHVCIIFYKLTSGRLVLEQVGSFIWMPYSSLEVIQVVHPDILRPDHTLLWKSTTALIYFASIEWHQVDKVLSQLRGVQHIPELAINIDFLLSKDGRGPTRWFPEVFTTWHQCWDERRQSVLSFQLVPDPRPSAEYFDCWFRVARRFLTHDRLLIYPRAGEVPVDALVRGHVAAPARQ